MFHHENFCGCTTSGFERLLIDGEYRIHICGLASIVTIVTVPDPSKAKICMTHYQYEKKNMKRFTNSN